MKKLVSILIILIFSNLSTKQEIKAHDHSSTLKAVGNAVISTQKGKTIGEKRLMAIRSSRMAAMRELAKKIEDIRLDSNTTVTDLIVQDDSFRAVVKGVIRSAKTVRINPTGDDTYETVLEIDEDMMRMMLKFAKRILSRNY